jgi:hypothetical protein
MSSPPLAVPAGPHPPPRPPSLPSSRCRHPGDVIRPFAAVTADGRRLFVKALGSDQRDADVLYRAYRAVRLRNVGDTRPAASLLHAVEHQALVGLMAERAGISAPGVDRVVRTGQAAPDRYRAPVAAGRQRNGRPAGQLTILDFSFSELDARPRQIDLDVAELLASLAVPDGEDRAYSGPERPARTSSAVASTTSPSATPPATSSGRWAPT